MKKILSLFILTYAFTLAAETPFSSTNELHEMFHEHYLDAEDKLDIFYLLAIKALEDHKSSLQPSELVQKFKNLALTPEIEQKYLSIYASQFKEEEREKVRELIHNGLYKTYRTPLQTTDMYCHNETLKIFEELAQASPAIASLKENHSLLHLTQENRQQVMESHSLIVIDVYTDWCGPCKFLTPVIQELDREYGHLYQFVKLNAEQEETLARSFHIKAFPTILFIKDGKEVGRHAGFMNKERFLDKIQAYFDNN